MASEERIAEILPESFGGGGFARKLEAWYGEHKRPLPWRETEDPYRIWISEIILQQTRVAQGLDYFLRFVERFPDVRSLAEADGDTVMRYWQGLGYYSRARNLHAAAREIVERFGGVFPQRYEEVLSLKGIGEYTAAAICSFAFRMPRAVVDGNVYRVLARLFALDCPIDSGEGRLLFARLADELLDRDHPEVYNQAIMDFGAVQCVPQSPACLFCPFSGECRAFAENRAEDFPVKQGRTEIKPRYFNYLHIRCGGRTCLAKRTGRDIWRNLYEFPLIETDRPVSFEELCLLPQFRLLAESTAGPALSGNSIFRPVHTETMPRHQLSHRTIHAVFYEMEWDRLPEGYIEAADGEPAVKYPVSRLTLSYLQRRGFLNE